LRSQLARSLRRIKPGRFRGTLTRRDDGKLPFVDNAAWTGSPLLLDICVYLDTLEGTLPQTVQNLLRRNPVTHLSVVLGELAHHFGRLKPEHPDTRRSLDELAGTIEDIPRHHIEDSINADLMLEAGIVSGLVFRLGGFQRGQEVAAMNDATIYLHALKRGYTVLTRNIRDFDFMNQILPAGRVLFYRTT
jgi:predicted nucleic acid-binding protein